MATAAESDSLVLPAGEASRRLADQWRRLRRAATFVALASSPAAFAWLYLVHGWSPTKAAIATFFLVIASRGLLDLVFNRFIPWPSLFATDSARLREEDVVNRRRAWFWRFWLKTGIVLAILAVPATLLWRATGLELLLQMLPLLILLPMFLVFNFIILFGPLLLMNLSQIQAFEPGDAEWGVRIQDVRGQVEAKEEVRRVVSLWQSGEAFERAGGKRERGLLFLGPPGTGKTMLAKAIATGFNSPFISIPGSGFAATFIGIDAIVVRILARRAKKLARKWGGTSIVFIDEIDAVGMRRQTLGQPAPGGTGMTPRSIHDLLFFGPNGALNPSGDLILETRAWRDRLFAERAAAPPPAGSWLAERLGSIANFMFPGGMGMGGGLALNQLLVVMDGIDNPPFLRRVVTSKLNTFLDATYFVPRRIARIPLRLPAPRPRREQVYFIGATNVPIDRLDPALVRPGRLGRHVWFRSPTKHDREDIFDLYLNKVAHDEDLDTGERRDELARVTNGYAQPLDSPVLTPDGWRRMGELAVGDFVVGAGGAPTRIVAVHPRGELDVFRVGFNDGTATECTADHLWPVEAADPRMVPCTLTTSELLERGLRWSPAGSRFYLPRLGTVEFSDAGELPLAPYLLGVLLGDGGFTDTSPDLCTADDETRLAVSALLPAGVSMRAHGPMNWWLTSGSRRGIPRSRQNPLTAELRALGLWGVDGSMKFVPALYRQARSADRLALLQGLMDSDGTIDYRRGTGAEFYSQSRPLADDVAFLARSLGGTARVRAKGDGWRVAVDLPEPLVPFRLERKAAVYRMSRKPFRKRIESIEPAGRKPVQCITVAADDGLYVTEGFTVTHNSPAMIEQVVSMALTIAHHSDRESFGWDDLTEAMTTLEAGTAVDIDYVPQETRAVAIHEAGHAVAGHVYMQGTESTRLSIRMRGGSLGHHQAREKEERFSRFRSEEFARLVWGLGALAAEQVFYGENATGVGGDVQTVTAQAAWMVGASAMGPLYVDVPKFADESEEETRTRVMERFERLGLQIMNRTAGGGPMAADPVSSVLADRDKRRAAAQILGQAYLAAHSLMAANKGAVERVAETLVQKRELFGDELVNLLDSLELRAPEVDYTDESVWPRI